ncbi:MAG: ADOP family duplicated permease [Gemmatimonadales bacterium]
MKVDPWWRRYWRSLGFGPEVAEELEFHVEMLTRELIAQGMSPEDARAEATRRFGDRREVQAQLETIERRRGRRLRLGVRLEEWWADVRYAVRGLVKRPAYTIAAVLSLALGIGTATVVFAIVDAWMFRPLPVDRPDRLVMVGATYPAVNGLVIPNISLRTASELRERRDLFDDVAAWRLQILAVRPGGAERSRIGFMLSTTGNYFDMLGVKASLGRVFSEGEAEERSAIVVLDHDYWRRQLGADPAIVGKTLLLSGTPFTVIGVAEPRFKGTEHLLPVEGYIPTGAEAILDPAMAAIETDPSMAFFQVIARRRDEVTLESLRAALGTLSTQLAATHSALPAGYDLQAFPEQEARPNISAAGRTMPAGIALMALAALILATAAVNVTNLILTRASGRQEEVAVRLALGASRWRVARQLLTESALLGLAGFAAAWGVAQLALDGIGRLAMASTIPLRLTFAIDGRVLLVSAVVALGAGLLSGIGPAIVASKGVQHTLRRAGRNGLGGLGGRFRAGLVVAQVSASFVVLVAAGLFIESVRRAASVPLGMQPTRVVTAGFQAVQGQFTAVTAPVAFERMAALLRQTPGVEGVSIATSVPLTTISGDITEVYLAEPSQEADDKGTVSAMRSAVDPAYFDVIGTPVIKGRAFTLGDDSLAARVAIVNEEAARRWWPGVDPIGRQIRFGQDSPPIEVVGVVPTGRYLLITEAPRPFVLVPLAQRPYTFGVVLIKSRLAPAAAEEALRNAAAAVNPDLAPYAVATMENTIKNGVNGLLPLRFGSMMTMAIGLLGLILTVVGLYGVLAFTVSQETREIGVRMALGADRGAIIGRVLKRGGRLLGIGVLLGAGVALLGTRLLASLLSGVSTSDVGIYLVVGTVLITVGAVAAYLPARRAAHLDPVRALRE